MQRRRLLSLVPSWLVLGAWAAHGPVQAAGRSVSIGLRELQEAVAQKFPRDYPYRGLADLRVQPPQLRLLPERNQLNALIPLQASGPLLQGSYAGDLDADFALRYEASDHTLRAYQIQLNALRMPKLPPLAAQMLDSYAPQLARKALDEVVLHQLRPQDLALVEGLGLQPGAITVTAKGLSVELVARTATPAAAP